MDPNVLLGLIVLWGAVVAACGVLVLALSVRRMERQHGLARSRWTISAAAATTAVVVLFAVGGTFSATRPGDADPVPKTAVTETVPANSAAAESATEAAELAEMERQRKELEEKLATLRKKIESTRGSTKASTERPAATRRADTDGQPRPTSSVPVLLLLGTVFVTLLGVVLIFVLGDPEVIFAYLFRPFRNQGELRLRARAGLSQMTAAVDRGDYPAALSVALTIDSLVLDRFERLDWLFLRAYAAIMQATTGTGLIERPLLEEAVSWLTTLRASAPDHAEATYLLATAEGFLSNHRAALDRYSEAESHLVGTSLPFAHNQSVCLLRLAEEWLGKGDADEAGRLFDRVTKLKVLADRIPTTLVKARLLAVRRELQAGRYAEAAAGLEVVRKLDGLEGELRTNVEVVCDVYQALVSIRRGDGTALARIDDFLTRYRPAGVPEPDESVADEYLEPPLAKIDLRVEPRVFGAFLFLKATALAQAVGRSGHPPSSAVTEQIARTLLSALQFELRQRDALAALGGLYYWFVPDKRVKALAWLTSAVQMGVQGVIARRILDRDKQLETENREALEWFQVAAGRFLHDPTVSGHVREALVEELGRFQGFQPLLLDLDRSDNLAPQEPSVRLLRERAEYMKQMVSEFVARKPAAAGVEFDRLQQEYARLIAGLESSSGRMAEIERRFVQEVGNSVLS